MSHIHQEGFGNLPTGLPKFNESDVKPFAARTPWFSRQRLFKF